MIADAGLSATFSVLDFAWFAVFILFHVSQTQVQHFYIFQRLTRSLVKTGKN